MPGASFRGDSETYGVFSERGRNMMKLRKRLIALAVSAVMAAGTCSFEAWAAPGGPSGTISQAAVQAYGGELGGMQYDVTFPVEGKKLSTALAVNDMKTFLGYKGQGYLYLTPSGLTNAEIFVNGSAVSLGSGQLADGNVLRVDISGVARNGANTIQVVNLQPDTGTLNVKIPYPVIIQGKPEEVGMSSQKLAMLDLLIEKEVQYGYPGGQLVIVKDGRMVKNTAYGYVNAYNRDGSHISDPVRTTVDTMYDLASNTKMYATNLSLEKLVDEGKLDISQKITDFFPNFRDPKGAKIRGKAELRVVDLLHHEAGFTAGPKFYREDMDVDDQVADGVNRVYSLDKQTTKTAILERLPLEYQPHSKTLYSDVDYMLLGFIVEEITGMPLDQYVRENFYQPMGLSRITFCPLQNGFAREDCAATELNGNSRDGINPFAVNRDYTIQGEVHDEKAFYSMGGVSGHAGLFANGASLAAVCQVMMNGGYGENRFFSGDVIELFTKPKDSENSYGLGWRRNGRESYEWAFGEQADLDVIGHTGWTGTLTVIDRDNNLIIVWLTNAKNSPVIDPAADKNTFVGDMFLCKTYGTIPTLVYESMNGSGTAGMDALLAQLVEDKVNLMAAQPKKQNYANVQDLYALADVAVTRAEQTRGSENARRAREAVAKLPDGAEKAAFEGRLNAVR